MELFFTDYRALETFAGSMPAGGMRGMAAMHVPDRMPFFLDESGVYLGEINAFLRDLPVLGWLKPNSWRAVAYDLQVATRFFEETGRNHGLLHSTFDDLRAFKATRRGTAGTSSNAAIAASSWNRAVCSLESYFDDAVSKNLIQQSPFRYRSTRSALPFAAGHGRNTLFDPVDEDGEEIRCISVHEYRIFRDVGLRGLLPDRRTADPSFEGVNGERNALIADFMANTGARVGETVSILDVELPKPSPGDMRARKLRIAAAVAKRGRSRNLLVASNLLQRFEQYRHKDRASAIGAAAERGRYGRGWIEADRFTPLRCRERSSLRPINFRELDAVGRHRLLRIDGPERAPAALLLSRDGTPLTEDAVRASFARASRRCQSFGYDFDVTPHVLRHTFAVHMLSLLVRSTIVRVAAARTRSASRAEHMIEEICMDPVRTVQLLLGHKSVTTTYLYLTHLEDVRRNVADAFADWGRELEEVAETARVREEVLLEGLDA